MTHPPYRSVVRALSFGVAALFTAFASSACGRGGMPAETASTPEVHAPKAMPAAVSVRPEPQDVQLADPALEPLAGARVETGRLGGSVYQIEVPDDWNGRLVLYMHGFQGLAPQVSVQPPAIRAYLVRHGYAWAASSFSSSALIPGRAADETAALWDFFAQTHGRPERSYIMGESMGGSATMIAAERYGDRFDGALALCGYAGQTAESQIVGDYFAAGAYVAGVTQADITANPDVTQLIASRIRPALDDPAKQQEFEDILIGMTGGERPFDREGLRAEDATNWLRTGILLSAQLIDNATRTYQLPASLGVTAPDFNSRVIRITADSDRLASFNDGNEITGALKMPLLTLHTTGDWQVPVDQEQILRRQVDAAGSDNLLVQRLVQAAPHCGFTQGEWERSFADLVGWVERGQKPLGDDVLATDLSAAGSTFTLAPRYGSSASNALPGAEQRVTVQGSLTLDGKPMTDGIVWAEVRRDGLRQICSINGDGMRNGTYVRVIAAATEMEGCGGPGSTLAIVALVGGKMYSTAAEPWPAPGATLTIDGAFVAGDGVTPDVTPLAGAALDAAGNALAPGTRIEAYIGDSLCGQTTIPRGIMQFSNPDAFGLLVAGPDTDPGCAAGGAVAFRINGAPVAASTSNDLVFSMHAVDLQLSP